MNKIQYERIMIAITLLATISSATVLPMVGADIPVKSKYVWRGAVFNTEPVLWPDVWINWYGVTLCAWGSIDMTDVKDKSMQLTDLAMFLDYTRSIGHVTPTLGFALYTYPGSAYGPAFSSTGELYAKVACNLGIVQASLNANYDVMEAQGFYISPIITKSLPIGVITPTFAISCGFADGKHNVYYYGIDKSCLTDLTASLKLSFTPPGALAKWLVICGDINYSMLLDSELADFVDSYGNANNFYGGGGISIFYSFGGE